MGLPEGYILSAGFQNTKPWRREKWVGFSANIGEYEVIKYKVPKAHVLVVTRTVFRIAITSSIEGTLVEPAGDLDFLTKGYFQIETGRAKPFDLSTELPAALSIGGVRGSGILNKPIGGENSRWSYFVTPGQDLTISAIVTTAVPGAFPGELFGVELVGWLIPEQNWNDYKRLIEQTVKNA